MFRMFLILTRAMLLMKKKLRILRQPPYTGVSGLLAPQGDIYALKIAIMTYSLPMAPTYSRTNLKPYVFFQDIFVLVVLC